MIKKATKVTDGQKLGIYLASNFGYTEEGRLYIRTELLPKLASLNAKVLDPWEAVLKMTDTQLINGPKNMSKSTGLKIGAVNFKLIDQSQIILANLNGPDPDSGTCIEIGYGYAKGKLVVAYRTDFRLSGEVGTMSVNLQVESAIHKSGGKLFRDLDSAIRFLKREYPTL